MHKVIKLDEGQIKINDNIIADITLQITYKLDNDYIDISTENNGGGNFIKIAGVNDDSKDNSINLTNFEDLLIMINHFKESYKKLVTNTKIK